MDNTRAAVETLKRALKLAGITYADVAAELGLSEASVKKMFASCHFTLKRIDRICAMIDLDFMDLVRLFDQQRQRIATLTLEQEHELMRDKRLLLVAVLARNHWRFDQIIADFAFTRAELIGYLNRLEQLGLLELHPNHRIRMRVAEDFRWLPHGPIESYFERQLQDEFLQGDFDNEHAMRLYLHGPLTLAAEAQLKRRINVLAHEFSELLRESAAAPLHERHNVGLLLAMREWEPLFVTAQRKQANASNQPAGGI